MGDIFYNELEIIGTVEQVNAVLEHINGGLDKYGKRMYIDFSKIIKMPEELVEKQCNSSSMSFSESKLEKKRIDWSYENWGCMYNARDQEKIDDNIIRFTLKDGGGCNLIEKLSESFPDVVFVYQLISDIPREELITFQNGEMGKYYLGDYIIRAFKEKGEVLKSSSK